MGSEHFRKCSANFYPQARRDKRQKIAKYIIHQRRDVNTDISHALCLLQADKLPMLTSTILVMRIFLAEGLNLDQSSILYTAHET